MNPLLMILTSFAGVAALSSIFAVQAAARRRRAVRRRRAREAGRLPSMEAVAGESGVLSEAVSSVHGVHGPFAGGRECIGQPQQVEHSDGEQRDHPHRGSGQREHQR